MAKCKYEINRVCSFCEHGERINDPEKVLCEYKGIVAAEFCCRKFIYDPLKRDPQPIGKLPGADKLDPEL